MFVKMQIHFNMYIFVMLANRSVLNLEELFYMLFTGAIYCLKSCISIHQKRE